MDIVGPLPNTIKGNQYILVVCVYAMRYPEAFILWMFTAPTVAEKLIKMVLFAYKEVPKESTGFSPFELIYSRDVRCD